MVKLKNIKIDGNNVKCDIFPEDSRASGILEISIHNTNCSNSCLLYCGHKEDEHLPPFEK